MKITLEINEEQVGAILQALDLYSRLQCGQVDEIKLVSNQLVPYEKLRPLVWQVKQFLFPDLGHNCSYSIASKTAPKQAQIAYDIYQALTYRLAWYKAGDPPERDYKTMLTVDFDEPMIVSQQPFPQVSIDELGQEVGGI